MKIITRRSVRSSAALAAALIVGFAFTAVAKAAPGDLDPTFSGDGKQLSNFGPGFGQASAIVRQPNGKVVAVGANESPLAPGSAFALARYKADGSLDPAFSGNGKQTTRFGRLGGVYEGVALQPDGKILAVGRTGGVNTKFALARYRPNGSLDPTFSGDGRQTTGFGGGGAEAVAIQADGKIVVVGEGYAVAGDLDFALARYNPNGSLDPSFSGDGRQTTNFGSDLDFASAVAIQAHGKIVAAGTGRDSAFALARYNPNGSLDPSFSGDGRQTTGFGGYYGANGVAVQADGRIVAAGDAADGAFALARYTPKGSLDPSFSGDGRQTTSFGAGGFDAGANAVAIRTDGKIVAVGDTGGRDFALARYEPNGTVDPRFSGDGKQTTDFGGFDGANGVALSTDGTIIAGGGGGGDHSAFALARYRANGSLDPTFAGDGIQTTDFGGPDQGNAVAIQANGRIVAVGDAAGSGFALARYDPDGSLDPSFSGDGKQVTKFDGGAGAYGVALQADGRIVAVGSARYGFGLARYNPNGSLDQSLSGDGKQTTGCFAGAGCRSVANAVAIQADGKIVVVGSVDSGSGTALARFKPNGSLDPSFSGDGMQTTWLIDGANGVAIQADGKIVVVGNTISGYDYAVARYKPNGSLDPSFSGDGVQTTDLGGYDRANGVAIQADGKIVAAGFGGGDFSYAGSDFAVARYNPNGSLDPSFSGDGMQTTDFGGSDRANGVALQANGRIVAVGAVYLGDHGAFALARYNPHGSLDLSFSGDGRQTTNFGSGNGAKGVALQGGKIVAVGSGLGTDLSSDFVVARYLGR